MSKLPLQIGISACFFHADPQRPIFKGKTLLYMEQSMANWVQRRGAMPWMIPSIGEGSKFHVADFVARVDGLILQGGSDVSPKSYGETPLKPEWNGDAIRDAYESALVRECVKQNRPVLGVCRGLQLLNVAFGGTLIQDIGTQLPQARNHRDWNIYDQNFHDIEFEKGSRLAEVFSGKKQRRTNTIHHQAIKDLGKGFVVEARCPEDGVIEAVRREGKEYVLAVQWHPEFQDPADPALLPSDPILDDFLKQVEERRK